MMKINFMFFSMLGIQVFAQEYTAEEIMKMVYDAPKPNSSITEIKLEIIRIKHGKEKIKVREFTRFNKNYSSGKFQSKSLVRFHKPLKIKDTGLLSWVYSNGKTDQWFFLPKLKTAKRVKAKEKTKSFMGTDFIYEDLESRKLGLDSLSLLGTEHFQGSQCKVIMAWPKKASSYFARKLWVSTKKWQIIKIEFYSSESNKEKTLILDKFVEENNFITPFRMIMTNQNGNKTIMVIQSFKPDIGLRDEIFSESFLIKI